MNPSDTETISKINKANERLQKRLTDCERRLYAHREYREQDDNPKLKKAKETLAYLKGQLELASRKMEDEEKKIETNTALKCQKIDHKIEELKEDIEAYRRRKEAEIAELEKQKEMIESDKDLKLDRCDNNPSVKYYMDEIKRRDDMLMEGVPKTRVEIQLEAEIAHLKEEIAKGRTRISQIQSYVADAWSCSYAYSKNPLFRKCEGGYIREYPKQHIKKTGEVVCKSCAAIAATKYYCYKCKEYKYSYEVPNISVNECNQHEVIVEAEPEPEPRNEIVEAPPTKTFKIHPKKATIKVPTPPESVVAPPDDYESVSTFNEDKFEKELEAHKRRAKEETDRQEAEVDKKYNKAMEEYNTKRAALKAKETSLRAEEDKIYKDSGYKYTDEYYKVKKQRQKAEEELGFLRLPNRNDYYPQVDY